MIGLSSLHFLLGKWRSKKGYSYLARTPIIASPLQLSATSQLPSPHTLQFTWPGTYSVDLASAQTVVAEGQGISGNLTGWSYLPQPHSNICHNSWNEVRPKILYLLRDTSSRFLSRDSLNFHLGGDSKGPPLVGPLTWEIRGFPGYEGTIFFFVHYMKVFEIWTDTTHWESLKSLNNSPHLPSYCVTDTWDPGKNLIILMDSGCGRAIWAIKSKHMYLPPGMFLVSNVGYNADNLACALTLSFPSLMQAGYHLLMEVQYTQKNSKGQDF